MVMIIDYHLPAAICVAIYIKSAWFNGGATGELGECGERAMRNSCKSPPAIYSNNKHAGREHMPTKQTTFGCRNSPIKSVSRLKSAAVLALAPSFKVLMATIIMDPISLGT